MTFSAAQLDEMMTKVKAAGAMEYSAEELETMLAKMQQFAAGIYPALNRIGCHPFIEFCGLMREYVKVCRYAYETHGTQFPFASAHGRTGLPTQPYHLRYLAEKLECIFAPMYLHSDASLVAFVEALLGPHLGRIPIRVFAKAWVRVRFPVSNLIWSSRIR